MKESGHNHSISNFRHVTYKFVAKQCPDFFNAVFPSFYRNNACKKKQEKKTRTKQNAKSPS